MQKFGWKRKVGAQVSNTASTAFESESKDNDDAEIVNGDVDWLTLVPLKRRAVVGLEDGHAKAQRLIKEGSVLATSERYWEALKKWDEALQYTPCDSKLHEMKAQALLELSELFPAVRCARKAVEYSPTWWVAHQTLGRTLLGLGEVRKAIKSFSRAIHLNPAERELWEEDLQWTWSLLKKKQILDEEKRREQSGGGAKVTPLGDEGGASDSEEGKNLELDIYRQPENPGHKQESEEIKRLPNNFVQMRDLDPT